MEDEGVMLADNSFYRFWFAEVVLVAGETCCPAPGPGEKQGLGLNRVFCRVAFPGPQRQEFLLMVFFYYIEIGFVLYIKYLYCSF